MNQNTFQNCCSAAIDECYSLLGMKSQEYSDNTDRLANFKKGAEALGLNPLEVWAVYYKKHVDAQFSFVRRACAALRAPAVPQTFALIVQDLGLSEPISGRFLDAINYNLLGLALINEMHGTGVVSPIDHRKDRS